MIVFATFLLYYMAIDDILIPKIFMTLLQPEFLKLLLYQRDAKYDDDAYEQACALECIIAKNIARSTIRVGILFSVVDLTICMVLY